MIGSSFSFFDLTLYFHYIVFLVNRQRTLIFAFSNFGDFSERESLSIASPCFFLNNIALFGVEQLDFSSEYLFIQFKN